MQDLGKHVLRGIDLLENPDSALIGLGVHDDGVELVAWGEPPYGNIEHVGAARGGKGKRRSASRSARLPARDARPARLGPRPPPAAASRQRSCANCRITKRWGRRQYRSPAPPAAPLRARP